MVKFHQFLVVCQTQGLSLHNEMLPDGEIQFHEIECARWRSDEVMEVVWRLYLGHGTYINLVAGKHEANTFADAVERSRL